MSRVTQGVRLINLREGQKVSSISIVDTEENDDIEELNSSEKDSVVDTSNESNDINNL